MRRVRGIRAIISGIVLLLVTLVLVMWAASAARAVPPAHARAASPIHVPLFVDPSCVRPTPRFRFTFDTPGTLARLRQEERLDALVAGAPDDLTRCARLMRWTRAQWEPGRPDPYPPLDARIILRDIRRGFTGGFCAQYSYVLAQAMQSLGLPARYVSLAGHEVIEAWLREPARWVCFDPLYDTWYADGSGRPLSAYEVHRRVLADQPVVPSSSRLVDAMEARRRAFARVSFWLKNDHVGSPVNFGDLERYKAYLLDDSGAASQTPSGALVTTEPADLYPETVDNPTSPHIFCRDAYHTQG